MSTNLWNLVMGSIQAGLRKELILNLFWAIQNGVPDLPRDASAQHQPQILSQAAPESSTQSEKEQSPNVKMTEVVEDEDDNGNQSLNEKDSDMIQSLSLAVRNCHMLLKYK